MLMLLVGENAQRTAGFEDVTGGFILPVCWGEKKSQEGRDVVVWHSSVHPGVLIIGSRPCLLLCSRSWGRMLFRKGHIDVDLNPEDIFSGFMVTLAPFPDGKSTCNLHF